MPEMGIKKWWALDIILLGAGKALAEFRNCFNNQIIEHIRNGFSFSDREKESPIKHSETEVKFAPSIIDSRSNPNDSKAFVETFNKIFNMLISFWLKKIAEKK